MTRFLSGLALGVMALSVGACGKVPSQYRGQYEDEARGFKLELGSSSGSWTRAGEAPRQFEARSLEAAALLRGEPGIYLRSIEQEGADLEVFWVNPDPATLSERYGFMGMRAQVLYTRLNSNASKAPRVILARFCDDGQILVDPVTQTFNGGCPASSALLSLKRIENARQN